MARRTTGPDGVKETFCVSWDDFIAELREHDQRPARPLYRGHGLMDWKLSSIFDRWLDRAKGGDPGRNVDELFGGRPARLDVMNVEVSGFRRIALRQLIDVPIAEDADPDLWLALARQHGATSPLLDWTRSPFIAAFFATVGAMEIANPGFGNGGLQRVIHRDDQGRYSSGGTSPPSGDIAIWALSSDESVWENSTFKLIDPIALGDRRLRAQEGVFTLLTHEVHVDVRSYLAGRGDPGHLERFTIPGQSAFDTLGDLQRMGITFSRLFPDLDGAAREANHTPWDLTF